MIDYKAGRMSKSQQLAWKAQEEFAACKTFIPNAAQFKLAQEIGHCQETGKYIFFDSSANGQGKTANLMNILCNIIFGDLNIYPEVREVQTGEKYNGFFDAPLYKRWPQEWPKVIWYTAEAEVLDKVVLPEFRKWFPLFSYKEQKGGKTYVTKIEFPGTGWEMHFKTREQDPVAFEGGNVGIWIADEPPKEWQYDGAHHRTRGGGIIIVTATPIIDSSYLFEKIVDRIVAGDTDKYHQSTDIWNNSRDKGGEWDLGIFGIQKKGNLRTDRILKIIANCDPDEYPARILGQGIHLSGRVFKTWKDEIHVVPTGELHMAERIWFVIDPHDAKPPFIQWWAIGPAGRTIVVNDKELFMPKIRCILEYPSYKPDRGYETIKDTKLTVADFCTAAKDIEKEWFERREIKKRIMDPRFGAKEYADTSLRKRMAVVDLYRHYALSCVLGRYQDIGYGTQVIKQMLDNSEGEPLLTVEEHCLNTIRAFRNYSYIQVRVKQDGADPASEKRRLTEKWKHAIDCTRYLVTWPPRFDGIRQEQKTWRDEMMEQAWWYSQGEKWEPLCN